MKDTQIKNRQIDFISVAEKIILNEVTQLIEKMYSCYKNTDASLIEINPLVLTRSIDKL